MAYQSVNPNTGKMLKSFEHLSPKQLETSIATAAEAFQLWMHQSYDERAVVVHRAAELLRSHVDDFAKLLTLEMGKRIDEARGEVLFSADILDYYAEHAEGFLARTTLHPKVGAAHIESSPLGVLFCVEPWNFPYYQLARVAGPQLMAGNVLLVKHAGCVPQCAIAFEKLFVDAAAPAGLYTNLLASYDQCDRIIDDPRVRGVALTGSLDAGRRVASRAGQNLKKSSMELGGSDAFIVLDDADLDHVIPWAVWGRMFNAGQTCCAAKRFIVLDAIADDFLARFKAALSALKPGDPMDEKTTHGPLSSEAALVQFASAGRCGREGRRQAADGRPTPRSAGLFSCSPRSSPTLRRATRRIAMSSSARWCRSTTASRTKPRRSRWPTIPISGSAARCGRRTRPAASAWPARSTPAWCSSTTSTGPMPSCLSADSSIRAMAANSATLASRSSSTRSWCAPATWLRRRERGAALGTAEPIHAIHEGAPMTRTMQAAQVEAYGQPLVLKQIDIPTPGPGQILVRTEACGVCHTDLHAAGGDWPLKPPLPFTPGHEGIGIVAALGAGVTAVKEGDRVGVPWLFSACGHCEFCLAAQEPGVRRSAVRRLHPQRRLCRVHRRRPELRRAHPRAHCRRRRPRR